MSKYIPGNHKHLTLENRIYIEEQLNRGASFKDIARFLCKDPSTISREVKKYRYAAWEHLRSTLFHNAKNFCVKRFRCRKTNACEKIILCGVKCRSCPNCNTHCKEFQKEHCDRLNKAPFVCNGCTKSIHSCTVTPKYRYDAKAAHRRYKELLSNSRAGLNMTSKDLCKLDKVTSELIFKGQTPYQIVANHPELNRSVRTIYEYIGKGILLAKNIDLKRKVKFKLRKQKHKAIQDRSVFVGRTYADFMELGLDQYFQMDTVHSARGSNKTILTFFHTNSKLLLAFIMNRCTSGAVKLVFNRMEEHIGTEAFSEIFKYILTDRGSEFGDPEALGTSINGGKRSNIYYCDPMRSGQKGGIEQAHTMLRNILPKGTQFQFLTQKDLNLIVNHINSTPRASLGGRTPYQVAEEILGADILKAYQLKPISPDEVTLTPKLIRNKR